jgi:4-hydroxy-tetrahydrodipicolinate synthase
MSNVLESGFSGPIRSRQDYSGIWVPLVTPFANDNSVDLLSLSAMVKELRQAGIRGFVVCGTTGEPAALNEAEKLSVLETVFDSCAGAPVMMGVTAVTPNDASKQMQCFRRFPLAGFLVTPPYYVRPSQRGVIEFFAAITKTSTHPIIIYDIPYRTGVTLDLATLRTLAQNPAIHAIKDCGGDVRKTQALIADRQLQVLCGDDHLIFSTLCQGGAGAIAASAHLHPELFAALYNAVQKEELHRARDIHHALAPLVEALFSEPSPAPLKSVLANRGCMNARVRLPMVDATQSTARAARMAYEKALSQC